MKTLIVLVSYHHKNTEKIAQTFADAIGETTIQTLQQVDTNNFAGYDLLGFGSGIYFGKPDKKLLEFVDNLPQLYDKKVFIFSTSGQDAKAPKFHKHLKEKLQAKGAKIVGEFNCPAFDTYGLLKIGGGINKGRPNEKDLKNAERFALTLKQAT
jgi:flavodoxin